MNTRFLSRLPWVTLTMAAAALLIAVAGLAEVVQFDRSTVVTGPLWRLVSCHLAHWSAEHLVWDLIGLLVLGWWCEMRSRAATVWCVAISAMVIGLGVWIFLPGINYYRGLSGIDSALFGLLVTMLIGDAVGRRDWRTALLPMAALVMFAAKVGHELMAQAAVFVHTEGMVPVPLAHLLGLACGAIIGMVCLMAEIGDRLAAALRRATGRHTPTLPSPKGEGTEACSTDEVRVSGSGRRPATHVGA